MALNLEKQLRFYGAYHQNPVNIGIHEVCVPLLMGTFWMLSGNLPNLLPVPEFLTVKYLPPNPGTLFAFGWTIFYILLEPVAGGMYAPLLIGMTMLGNYLRVTYGMTANYAALGIHVVSWIAQFIGHGVFEGRAPALFTSLYQSLVLAGLFVWMEILFQLGYRPELRQRLEKKFAEDRANLDRAQGKTLRPVTRSQTKAN